MASRSPRSSRSSKKPAATRPAAAKVPPRGPPSPAEAPEIARMPPGQRSTLAAYVREFFQAGQERALFADDLQSRIAAGEDLYLVDLRDPAAYLQGHLPDAVNLQPEELFTDETLDALARLQKPIVLASANGHLASMVAGVLGPMGYNVYVLRLGMFGWNPSTLVQVYSSRQVPQAIHGLRGPVAR